MISHFWNLCRACPALDVDKVSDHVLVKLVELLANDNPTLYLSI